MVTLLFHESGAIEATGHKVLTLPAYDGKVKAICLKNAFVKAGYKVDVDSPTNYRFRGIPLDVSYFPLQQFKEHSAVSAVHLYMMELKGYR